MSRRLKILVFLASQLSVTLLTYQSCDIKPIKTTKRDVACIDIIHLLAGIEQFEMENGFLPESLRELWLPANKEKVRYLAYQPIDPWGNPYVYVRISSDDFEIKSLGADAKEGGEGENRDITGQEAKKRFRKMK